MIIKTYRLPKILAITSALLLAVVLLSGSVASAQTVFTNSNGAMYMVPAGYQTYTNGTYYNPTTNTYYNAQTGQYSSTAPVGAAPANSTGGYTIPSGYTGSSFGTYYNPTTGQYYDPATGFYSTSAPVGPMYPVTTTTGVNTTIGLPNTGAGGNAATTWALLAVSAAIIVGASTILLSRRNSIA
jgi:hypothetical protein